MKVVTFVQTCYGQRIELGTQIAYALPVDLTVQGHAINVRGGGLRVAKVVEIIQTSEGFAEADPSVELVLDNADRIDCTKVAVTDQKFRYGERYSQLIQDVE